MKRTVALSFLLLGVGFTAQAADWPAWRGPTGQGFCELLADNRLPGESTNSSVVFCNGDLFIRTFKHLWCFGKTQ